MAFLSVFCICVGCFFIFVGYLIAFKKKIILYKDKYPESILSQTSHETIGSDVVLSGIVSITVGLTELLIPEFQGRLFYFLIVCQLLIAFMMLREGE